MNKFSKILQFITPYWFKAVLNVIFNILSSIFALSSVTLAIPFLGILFETQPLIESVGELDFSVESLTEHFYYFLGQVIISEGKKMALLYLSILIVAMSFLKTSLKYIATYYLSSVRNGVIKDIRNKIFAKSLILPLSYYSEEKKGDIIARMTNDVQEIEWSIIASLEMLFRDPITIIIYLIALLWMSPQLTLFVIILLPVSGFIIGQTGKSLKKTSLKGQKKMGVLLSIIEETLSGLRIIKAFNAEEKVNKRFTSINSFYTRIMIKMTRRRYLATPLSEFLGTIVMMAIMVYGGSMVLNNDFSPQVLMGYLMMFYFIITPAKSFSTAYYSALKGMASVDRIDAILSADISIREKTYPKPIEKFSSSIEYKKVFFKYATNYVLKDINIKIEKGKTIALVGQSGSGKSTLVDLLPRFYDVTKGDILIDGFSIKDYKIIDLRSLMGNVNQEPILFNDSFFNNIAFGVNNATEQEVISAAKVANAHDFIMETKYGYYTSIGDRGGKLSGGQRQRISIARAVLKNPPILILDEATSSLDTESERLVQDALTKLMKDRTSIVIAHRLSTVKYADEIYVLHNGEIIEKGKHNVLITKKGMYKKLHELQVIS